MANKEKEKGDAGPCYSIEAASEPAKLSRSFFPPEI